MLKNAYSLAKIGADTAENEQNFAEKWPKIGTLPYGSTLVLPARSFGLGLGYLSTRLRGRRGFAITTSAVETFAGPAVRIPNSHGNWELELKFSPVQIPKFPSTFPIPKGSFSAASKQASKYVR